MLTVWDMQKCKGDYNTHQPVIGVLIKQVKAETKAEQPTDHKLKRGVRKGLAAFNRQGKIGAGMP